MKKILALLFSTATLMATAQDTSVIKMEYFVDTDPGVGNATSMNIPASADVTFPFTVNLTGYAIGYHKLYIRTRDNLGRWSFTARRNIEVLASQTQNNVVSGEYFIDQDPGFGAGSPIIVSTPDTMVLQGFTAALTGLAEGFHKLYGRFKDTYGNWSQTFRRNIEVIKDENNQVINGEYFFRTDNGFGNCSPVVFATPSADGTFTFNIPAAQVPANADTLFVRVRDDIDSRWSLTRLTTVNTALPLTLLNFTGVKQSDIVQLNWQTTNEINTSYFNVKRSTDALHFTTVGVVKTNNVSSINNYSYPDNVAALSAETLYYRLQEVDLDGESQYSEIVAIKKDNTKTGISIYPNPARSYLDINSDKPEDLNGATLTIVDMAGQVTLKQTLLPNHQQQINISGLSKGIYIVHILKVSGVESHKLLIE